MKAFKTSQQNDYELLPSITTTESPIHYTFEDGQEQSATPVRRLEQAWYMTTSLQSIVERCRTLLRANTGLLLIAAAQGFFALMNIFVKTLNSLDPPVPALELIIVRMGITYVCCITYMLWMGVADPFFGPREVRLLLAFRGFSGFFGLFGVYYSLQYLSVSDATVLTFLAPTTTAIAGYLLLGEPFSRKEAVAGLLSLVGVILIARPRTLFGSDSTFSTATPSAGEIARRFAESTTGTSEVSSAQRLGAVGVAMIGVLGATGAYTSIRAIGKRAHPLHTMTYFSTQCVITATGGMIFLRIPPVFPTRFLWFLLLLMIGIFGFLAQTLLTMGLQREEAGRGTMAVYVQIIFASVLEGIFFNTVPSALSVVGTVIIVGSAVFVALTKDSQSNPAQTTVDEDSEPGSGTIEHEDGLHLGRGDGMGEVKSKERGSN